MAFKSLTSDLGQVFAIGIKITGIVYFGFLIYAIIEQIYGAIIVVGILMAILYFTYLRKLIFSKRIEFSKKTIKINGKEIGLDQISEIKNGVLLLKDNTSKKIYFNHHYSHNRLNELKRILDNNR